MRISDWSSDVCSSDLCLPRPRGGQRAHQPLTPSPWIPWDSKNSRKKVQQRDFFGNQSPYSVVSLSSSGHRPPAALLSNIGQIGRASCRERVCQSVWISVVVVPLKKKKQKNNL